MIEAAYTWQFTPAAILYLLAALTTYSLFILSRRIRPVPGRNAFSTLCFFLTIWAFSYLLGFFNTNENWKYLLFRFEYVGIFGSTISWFVFTVRYTHSSFLDKPLNRILIAIIPLLAFVALLSFHMHDLYYKDLRLVQRSGLIVVEKEYGIIFYVQAMYNYFLILAGSVILFQSLIKMPSRYQEQLVPLVSSLILLIVPNFLYIAGQNPFQPYDPTSITFTFVGMLLMYVIYKHQFLNVVPVAHDLVFQNVKTAVMIVDNNGHVISMNPEAEKLIDAKSEFSLGKHINALLPGMPTLSDRIASGSRFTMDIAKEGRLKSFDVHIDPLLDKGKILSGGIIMLYDNTEQRATLRELDAYAHSVAHDLKNPLNLFQGFSQMLLEEDLTETERVQAARAMLNGAQKMKQIIDSLLLLASVRRRKDVPINPMDMNLVVKQALNRFEDEIRSEKVEIIQPKNWPSAMGYAPWVEEVFCNYVSNAIKYGGRPAEIILGYTEGSSYNRYWVKDNGKGIPDREQKNLFTEFSRLEEHRKEVKGHGLGLSIVKRIMERLNGQVGMESGMKGGSLFYFELPVVKD